MALRAVAGSSGGGLVGSGGGLMLQLVGNGTVLVAGTFYFTLYAPFNFTVQSLAWRAGVGSFTANVKIGATSITGLSAVNVNSPTITLTAASGANTVVEGDAITVVVTSPTSSPTDCVLQLLFTRD